MVVEINWIAVVLAAVSSMAVGGIWYSKQVFGGVWMSLNGFDPKKKTGMFMPMLGALVASVLTAYILAHVAYMSHSFFGHSFFMDAVDTALWLWLGISATTLLVHYSFDRRPWKLTAIAIGNRFVTFMVMGMIIGLIRP